MAKHLKMNLKTGEVVELSGTDSLPHPGNFPLGSPESRAAARAMARPGRVRVGDEGISEDGQPYFACATAFGRPVQVVLPCCFPAALVQIGKKIEHAKCCAATPAQRAAYEKKFVLDGVGRIVSER